MKCRTHLAPILLGSAILLSSAVTQAGQLIYQPINPSFGGDPLLGNHLLNKAQAQDTKRDPNAPDFGRFSETEFFIQDLRAKLINDAIQDAVDGGDGESIIDSSTLRVELRSSGGGSFSMTILDKTTGETTTVNFGQPF
ncbi:curli assembly protein CsgF [Halomonas sp. BC04]|uniref:curli assembly protein CsgF n=1 Tax=Halomonas sp. BC04 TaxID=1403540 RepID=UPI0003ED77A6|nr:curli assembly protein CsgF [Halomonas sp. BC04]EWH00946.1 hypothetical protein Q427_16645 [Halomonas sp. BC04]